MANDVQVSFRISKALNQALTKRAEAEGLRRSDVIRDALEAYLDAESKPVTHAELRSYVSTEIEKAVRRAYTHEDPSMEAGAQD